MIEEHDKFVECSVVMSQTDKPSNIKKIGDKIEFVEKSSNGINYKVEFFIRTNEGDKVVASTEPIHNVVQIGHDFIWKFCEDVNITTVNVIFNKQGKPKVKNGYVVVNPVVKKFGISDLQSAFEAGRRHTYDAFNEEQSDFVFENFNDWYNNKLKNDNK